MTAPHTLPKAVLVHVKRYGADDAADLEEFRELARSAGVYTIGVFTCANRTPSPKFFIGTGKAQEIKDFLGLQPADIVLVDHPLSPGQERNLTDFLKCRVIDRTGLILDIFAQRARTFEGKLQVELAQLNRLATRLVGGWTHLERQKGGIGLRGPGETQLETDRRLMRKRIKTLEERLQGVLRQRKQNRRARQRNDVPVISLIGYTNAGKSTLFNAICSADVFAENLLFATLDPTVRRIKVFDRDVLFTDTVGFIRHLPHDLVAAFRATLEEIRESTLLLHVIDASSGHAEAHIASVQTVLTELGATDVPVIEVYNKIDLDPTQVEHVETDEVGLVRRLWVSARTGAGIKALQDGIEQYLFGKAVVRTVTLGPDQARLRAQLYEMQAVRGERVDEDGNWKIEIQVTKVDFARLFH